MKHLRKRFIAFNMLVISCIMVILILLVGLSENSTLSIHKMIVVTFISIGLVFIGSWLLSKVAIAPIKTAWQKQLDFTADASHELRTPLTTIQTNLDVILSNPKETVESQIKWLNNINIENKRMSILVADLLLISRADTDEAIINTDNLYLSELITEAVTAFEPVAEDKQLAMVFHIEQEIFIMGDKDKLKQLFVILLDNAVKYTPTGGKIIAVLSQNESDTIIEISDTGIGLTQEEAVRIFDRFYRGKQSRLHNPDGSGLGLSIAKLIAEEHKGKISVKSKIGEGTVFNIVIPNVLR